MKEFIDAMIRIDKQIQRDIIKKINKKEKLNNNQILYLIGMKKLIEREKHERYI